MNLENKLKKLTKEAELEYEHIMGHKPNYNRISLDRAKSRLGLCRHEKWGNYITIATRLVERHSDKEIKDTILHEFLHTEPGCRNHREKWKAYARKFDVLGYHIQRCSNLKETDEEASYKYFVKCSGCGRVVRRRVRCDIIKHPEYWRCGKCGGKFEKM